MSPRRNRQPGPEEQAELEREERDEARDEVSALGADTAEEDDGEETLDEILEIDQTELGELGLTLDDPHQPDGE